MGTDYQAIAYQDAVQYGIDPTIFTAQIRQESGFNPNAVSPAGAIGIAQFMPGTAAGLGFDPHDPIESLKQAAKLMASYVKQYGGYEEALAAYNWGPGNLENAKKRGGDWHQYLPLETKNYIAVILGNKAGSNLPVNSPVILNTPTTSDGSSGSSLMDTLKTFGLELLIFVVAIALVLAAIHFIVS